MDKDAYIKQLENKIIELEKRIEELERLLGMNSMNSSKPPSSDPPGISVILPKQRHKKHGAKKGHQPHLRELLPPNMVKQCFDMKPQVCTCGSTNLWQTAQVNACNAFWGRQTSDAADGLSRSFCRTIGGCVLPVRSFAFQPAAFWMFALCGRSESHGGFDIPDRQFRWGESNRRRPSCPQKNTAYVLHWMDSKRMIQDTCGHSFILQ